MISLSLRKWYALLVALLFFASSATFAAGSGDHHHSDDEEPVIEDVVPNDTHDADDGHHDTAIDPIHEQAPVELQDEAVGDPQIGHHEDAATTPHDNPADASHDDDADGIEHDHSAHEESTWARTGFERLFAWLGKFHPAATNFPIALLLMALVGEVLFMASGNLAMRHAARFCLWTGALSAAATAALGWGFVGFDFSEDDPILSAHRWNGTALGVVALLTLWLGERSFAGKGFTGMYRIALVLVALMVGLNGYLGGKMVYGADHYDWPESQSPEEH